ncbi:MAG: ABC transporter ATP-binding protein, partial [Haloarculaceae archaeon]
MNAIDVRDVSRRYGDVPALDGLSLSVERDSTFGVFGANGAGKTTLFKILLGLDRPDEGAVRVAGHSPTAGIDVREHVGYLPEHAGFPPNLTGREILTFHARVRGVPEDSRERRVERVLRTVGLTDAADRRVGGYSNGMNRRLGLGTTLVADPEVLILDEPTAGLDPRGIDAFHGVIESLADDTDVTVVFSSHNLAEIEQLCDEAAIFVDGEVVARGDVDDLRQSGTVTVEMAFDSPETARAAAAEADDYDGATVAHRSGPEVTIECASSVAYDLLR